MALERSVNASAISYSRIRVIRKSPTRSIWAVEKRLASAERELRVQFTRIAQLQAELDLVLAAIRRSPDGVRRPDRTCLAAAV